MNVSLTPKLEELVHAKVATGMYNNASEVIREALRLMEETDQLKALKLQILKKELSMALDSLERGEYSTKSVNELAGEVLNHFEGE